MVPFLRYWYLQSPAIAFRSLGRAINFFEAQLAVRATLQNLNKPLFQDYTFQGRIIGVFLRLGRAFLGGLLYLLISLVYLGIYLLWLIFPLLCLVSLVGSFLGGSQ